MMLKFVVVGGLLSQLAFAQSPYNPYDPYNGPYAPGPYGGCEDTSYACMPSPYSGYGYESPYANSSYGYQYYSNEPRILSPSDEKALTKVAQAPVRNLEEALSKSALRRHKTYISLTTTPQRIEKLSHVLKNLDTTHIEEIFLNLPQYKNGKKIVYKMPKELLQVPKLRVLYTKEDLGPGMKLAPSAKYLQKNDPLSYLITIDDDMAYPKGMVNEMIYNLLGSRKTVWSAVGQDISFWGINSKLWPKVRRNHESNERDVVEGFSAIGYRVADVPVEKIIELLKTSLSCKLSDDLVVAYALAENGVKKKLIANEYYNEFLIKFFDFGFQADALHKGGDLGNPQGMINVNPVKYKQCLMDIQKKNHPK